MVWPFLICMSHGVGQLHPHPICKQATHVVAGTALSFLPATKMFNGFWVFDTSPWCDPVYCLWNVPITCYFSDRFQTIYIIVINCTYNLMAPENMLWTVAKWGRTKALLLKQNVLLLEHDPDNQPDDLNLASLRPFNSLKFLLRPRCRMRSNSLTLPRPTVPLFHQSFFFILSFEQNNH